MNIKTPTPPSPLQALLDADMPAFRAAMHIHSSCREVDSQGNTALHLLLSMSTIEPGDVLRLLKSNVPINARNNRGYTPLHVYLHSRQKAVAQDSQAEVKILNALLESRADPNIAAPSSETPLTAAARRRPHWLPLLFAHGGDPFSIPIKGGFSLADLSFGMPWYRDPAVRAALAAHPYAKTQPWIHPFATWPRRWMAYLYRWIASPAQTKRSRE